MPKSDGLGVFGRRFFLERAEAIVRAEFGDGGFRALPEVVGGRHVFFSLEFKMTSRAVVVAAFALVAVPSPAHAGFMTGNSIYADCKAGGTYCAGYVEGMADGFGAVVGPSKLVCVPPGVTSAQIVDVVAKYLTDHPETRNEDGGLLGAFALMTAFPCPAQ